MAVATTFQSMFAEVSDKIPTTGGLWCWGVIAAVLIFATYRLSRYSLLLSFPLAGLWLGGIFHAFYSDASFKSAVVTEMGWSYLLQVIFISALPSIAAIVCGVLFLRSLRSLAAI